MHSVNYIYFQPMKDIDLIQKTVNGFHVSVLKLNKVFKERIDRDRDAECLMSFVLNFDC